jgi:hypothetical protein
MMAYLALSDLSNSKLHPAEGVATSSCDSTDDDGDERNGGDG